MSVETFLFNSQNSNTLNRGKNEDFEYRDKDMTVYNYLVISYYRVFWILPVIFWTATMRLLGSPSHKRMTQKKLFHTQR